MFNSELHEQYMKQILFAIFSADIGQFLAFKGGTLAYRRHNLDRFSTDIDLDLLDNAQEELVVTRIQEILVRLGDIKNEILGKEMHRWIFRYDANSMNIKVELNKRIWKNNVYLLETIHNQEIMCMNQESIFTNKLIALSERFYPRDLYDVHFFFKRNFTINPDLITERTTLILEVFLKNLLEELPKRFPENAILTGLGELLDNKQKYRVKHHLLSETIEQVQQFLPSQGLLAKP